MFVHQVLTSPQKAGAVEFVHENEKHVMPPGRKNPLGLYLEDIV